MRTSENAIPQLIPFDHETTCARNARWAIQNGHGFIGYPNGRNVERALGFLLTGTVSTSPNLAKEGARSATIITRPSGSRFSYL